MLRMEIFICIVSKALLMVWKTVERDLNIDTGFTFKALKMSCEWEIQIWDLKLFVLLSKTVNLKIWMKRYALISKSRSVL